MVGLPGSIFWVNILTIIWCLHEIHSLGKVGRTKFSLLGVGSKRES